MVEQFTERLTVLQEQLKSAGARLQQANADIIAISGAMQEVKYWIDRLDELSREGEEERDDK